MKKYLSCILLVIIACKATTPSLPVQQHFGTTPKTQTITFVNESDRPVIISALIEKHKDLGVRGFLIPAKSKQALELEEFYWFSRVASGGYGKSKVKMVDVLNHGFADTLLVQVPNQEPQTFPIKEADYDVTISMNDSQRIVVEIESAAK